MTMNPLISIIVIGRNEGERLVRCLQSIHGINTTGFRAELILCRFGLYRQQRHTGSPARG